MILLIFFFFALVIIFDNLEEKEAFPRYLNLSLQSYLVASSSFYPSRAPMVLICRTIKSSAQLDQRIVPFDRGI